MRIFSQPSRISELAAATLLTGIVFVAFADQSFASCKQRICVHGTDDGNVHNVYITSEYSGVTHYNVRYPDGRQFEVSPDDTRFSFGVKAGRSYQYSVQACQKKGLLEGSTCTPWVPFTHTVNGD